MTRVEVRLATDELEEVRRQAAKGATEVVAREQRAADEIDLRLFRPQLQRADPAAVDASRPSFAAESDETPMWSHAR